MKIDLPSGEKLGPHAMVANYLSKVPEKRRKVLDKVIYSFSTFFYLFAKTHSYKIKPE